MQIYVVVESLIIPEMNRFSPSLSKLKPENPGVSPVVEKSEFKVLYFNTLVIYVLRTSNLRIKAVSPPET